MSEHTKGRLVVKGEWLIPSAHDDRMIGGSTRKAEDKSCYAHNVAIVRGKYQDDKANARRLAACWNAFDAPCMTTPMIEALVNIGGVDTLSETAAHLTKELTAARALLREVRGLIDENIQECDSRGLKSYEHPIHDRIRSYLDACDTLEGKPNAS